jgi:phosphoglycolate phosphatase
VLFDLDGVLADSRGPIAACINAMLIARGYPARSDEDIAQIIGPPIPDGIGWLLRLPPDSDEVTAAVADYRERYETGLWDTRSYDGVPEAVRAIGERRRLAVATSKGLRYAQPVLEAIGLADAFDVVAAPRPGGPLDKHAMIAEALEALGEPAAAMIGDRRYDIEAARDHGLLAVGVLWGFGSREELERAGADVLAERPSDLGPLLTS